MRMQIYLSSLGYEVLMSVENGYCVTTNDKEALECNHVAKKAILSTLSNDISCKVMHCVIAQDVWKELRRIYQGDDKEEDSLVCEESSCDRRHSLEAVVVQSLSEEANITSDDDQEYDEQDCEIDMEGELIYALSELNNYKKENHKLTLQLQQERDFKDKALSNLQEASF